MLKHPLFQVTVEAEGTRIAVGPRQPKSGCEKLIEAISAQICQGREKVWKDPQIAPVFI